MSTDDLPDDLVEFLESDRRLKYDASACEIGIFTFHALDEIKQIDLTVSAKDHQSTCTVRALDLVKSCEGYDPKGMFVYIPSLRKYGSYDSESQVLITYGGMTWSNFLADPARYINAAWDNDPEIAEATFSEAAADRIVEVYSAANGFEAHALCTALEDKGIRTQVVGESLAIAAGDLPPGFAIAPKIWVREGDSGRAREIIEDCTSQPRQERSEPGDDDEQDDVAFFCEECGSGITFPLSRCGHVETCPNCGNYVDVPD
jgi:hypothetical protein